MLNSKCINGLQELTVTTDTTEQNKNTVRNFDGGKNIEGNYQLFRSLIARKDVFYGMY